MLRSSRNEMESRLLIIPKINLLFIFFHLASQMYSKYSIFTAFYIIVKGVQVNFQREY